MEIKLTGRHFEVSPSVKEHLELKATKLTKFYDSVDSVEIIIEGVEDGKYVAEVIAKGGRSTPFVVKEAGSEDDNLYKVIDAAFDKAERQLKKAKGKERNPMHAG